MCCRIKTAALPYLEHAVKVSLLSVGTQECWVGHRAGTITLCLAQFQHTLCLLHVPILSMPSDQGGVDVLCGGIDTNNNSWEWGGVCSKFNTPIPATFLQLRNALAWNATHLIDSNVVCIQVLQKFSGSRDVALLTISLNQVWISSL